MEKNNFKRILFKTAFCCMACDGEIHEKEISELKWIYKNTQYFTGVDFSNELETLISEVKVKGKEIIDDLIDSIDKEDLSTIQELLLLEIALRLIGADESVKEIEIKFIRFLRSRLKVPNQIIKDRFGFIDYLFDRDYSKDITDKDIGIGMIQEINFPSFMELQKIDLSKIKLE